MSEAPREQTIGFPLVSAADTAGATDAVSAESLVDGVSVAEVPRRSVKETLAIVEAAEALQARDLEVRVSAEMRTLDTDDETRLLTERQVEDFGAAMGVARSVVREVLRQQFPLPEASAAAFERHGIRRTVHAENAFRWQRLLDHFQAVFPGEVFFWANGVGNPHATTTNFLFSRPRGSQPHWTRRLFHWFFGGSPFPCTAWASVDCSNGRFSLTIHTPRFLPAGEPVLGDWDKVERAF